MSAEGETSVDGSGLFCKEGTQEKNEKMKSYMGLQESGETCIHIVYADLVSSVTLLDTSSHTQENK